VPCGGHCPFSAIHPFLSVFPGLSSELSSLQVERGHPCWQYPHGTKSHDPQAPGPLPTLGARVGSADGALDVLGMLLGDADGSDDACTVGALVGSLLVGALLGLTVGEELGSDDVVPVVGVGAPVGALVGSLDGAQTVMQ